MCCKWVFSNLDNQYTINGVIDTNAGVLENMEKIALASGCWITYDIHAGLWSVIINQAGDSVKSYNDSNIIGSVSLNSTGITELYNGVKVNYPRSDIADQIDFVQVELPTVDMFHGEQKNILEMTLDLCNDPVQAELIAAVELGQNRLDKVISFTTDYTSIDLNAGDIIDVTNSTLGFTAKEFRVISMRELDADDGSIAIEVTALEYNDSIYEPALNRYSRSTQNGIITKGNIGTSAAPQISRFESSSRPRILFEAVTPSGIVDGIEFWISQTSASTGFYLADIVRPQGGGSFGSGITVETDVDNINSGTIWAKVRAVNSTTTGAFSPVATDTFTPVQIPDAIGPSTEVVDSNGDSILGLTAGNALLALLGQLIDNNASGTGSLFDQIFQTYDDVTGVNILDPQNIGGATGPQGPPGTTGATGATGPAGTGGVAALGDIPNVYVVGAVSGEVLLFDGYDWTNSPALWEGARKWVQPMPPGGAMPGDIWFEI